MLYEWSSSAMSDYQDGHIVVEANSAEEAKAKLKAHVEKNYKGYKGCPEMYKKFQEDMKAEPIPMGDIVMYMGSA